MHQNSDDSSKFFVDAMLGNLARKLRLFGYDAKYSSDIDDDQLIKESKNEYRVILTKDLELVKKAQKTGVSVVLISDGDDISQIIHLKKEMNLPDFVIDVNNTRCTSCNRKLDKISKNNVENLVPKGVFNNNELFWYCMLCRKIYWEGSHIDNLKKFVVKLNERI